MKLPHIVVATCSTVVLMFLISLITYDSVCGFAADCNRGINPTMYHGWPLPIYETALYSGPRIHLVNSVGYFIICYISSYLFITNYGQKYLRR